MIDIFDPQKLRGRRLWPYKKKLDRLRRKLFRPFATVEEEPVFLLGNQKSGTTAIGALLARSCGRSATLDFWPYLKAEVLVDLHDGRLPFDAFIHEFRYEFSRSIIKEPQLTFLYPGLRERFPRGRFAAVVRDPYQNIRSILNRLDIPGDLTHLTEARMDMVLPEWRLVLDGRWLGLAAEHYIDLLAERWNVAADLVLSNPEIVLVRYEDFTADKAGQIEALAGRLGLGTRRSLGGAVHRQYQPRGDRRASLDEFFGENLDRIARRCGESMRRLGYEAANP